MVVVVGNSGRDFPVGMVKESQGAGFSLSGHRCKFSKVSLGRSGIFASCLKLVACFSLR